MGIEYDAAKAERNYRKHGVRFEDAAGALEDQNGITAVDTVSDPTELRYATVGMSHTGRLVTVIYTVRDEVYRLISARKATRHERELYTEGL